MKLLEFLASSFSARVDPNNDRWLVVRYDSNRVFTFTVYERKRYARNSTILLETYSEKEVVAAIDD